MECAILSYDSPPKVFSFRAASIRECELCSEFLSERTMRSIVPDGWVNVCSNGSAQEPEVYVCEAFGGASATELTSLIEAIERAGRYVILLWTDDWAFPPNPKSRSLVFDVSGQPPLSCSYGWDALRYAPDCLAAAKPFAERRILASFVGSRRTHGCRQILFDAAITDRPDVLVEDVNWWGMARASDGQTERAGRKARFAEILLDSKFAFCPRGNGPSSKRRWEAAYCGAIPILIDDFTQPFGAELPLPRFTTNGAGSLRENALDLLTLVVRAIPDGDRLQARLRDCLMDEFDVPLLASSHTMVRQVVRIANRAWIPGQGFAADAS
jgi:hypothetical protein